MKPIVCLVSAWLSRVQMIFAGVLIMIAINGNNEQAMAADTSVIGWIEIQADPDQRDHVSIRGRIHALETVEGNFQLRVARINRGNKSANAQRGHFRAKAGEAKVLSSTTINLDPNDLLQIKLTLFVDGEEVFFATAQSP